MLNVMYASVIWAVNVGAAIEDLRYSISLQSPNCQVPVNVLSLLKKVSLSTVIGYLYLSICIVCYFILLLYNSGKILHRLNAKHEQFIKYNALL